MDNVNLNETLQRKIGPLPVWSWGVIVGGGALVIMKLTGRGGGSETPGTADGLTAVGAGTHLPSDGGGGGGTHPVPKQSGPCGRVPNWKPSKNGRWDCNKDIHKWVWTPHITKPKPKPRGKCNQHNKPPAHAGYHAVCVNGQWRMVRDRDNHHRTFTHESDMMRLARNTLDSHKGEQKHSPPSVSNVRVRSVSLPAPRASTPTPRVQPHSYRPRQMTTATRVGTQRHQVPERPAARRYGSPRPS